MSHDQCHSTVKGEKQKPGKAELASSARSLHRANGHAVWRSMDEMVDTPDFREHLEREFPSGMAELVTRERLDLSATGRKNGESRREFLKLMGASVALAGAAASLPGCRRPEHKIYAYGKNVPEEVIPGKPLYYTTSMARWDGGAEGLLVETHEGRPTKVEGNPLHPVSNGKVSMWALASIMSLYDPDRPKFPAQKGWTDASNPPSWDNFRAWAAEHFKHFDGNGGAGLAFLVEKNSSPTRAMVRDKLLKKYPGARWVPYSAGESVAGFAGTRMAFGKAMREVLNFSADTRVVVSLDHDFLQFGPGELPNARGFAASRVVAKPGDPMSRLYVVESAYSVTGGQADHRMRLAPSRVTAFACALARRVLAVLGDPAAKALAGALPEAAKGEDIHDAFVEECANDLLDAANRGKSVITAGPTQPAIIHAVAAAMNAALENVGRGVAYIPVNDEWASASGQALGALARDIEAGTVTTLVCVNTNPAYDAPGDCRFAEAMKTSGLTTITLSVGASETADLSAWSLNGSHYLESWGDTRAIDGTVAPVQPMIAPLYEVSMSDIELLALLAGKDMNAKVDGYELVRECWQTLLADSVKGAGVSFDTFMRRCLHNGVVPGTAFKAETPKADLGAVAKGAADLKVGGAPSKDSLEVVFSVGNLADGRFANVGWLQELPAAMTRVVWDNPVLLSPKTAMELGVAPLGLNSLDTTGGTDGVNAMYDESKYPHGRVAELKLNGRTVKAAVWVCPGLPDNTAVLLLGYGRTSTGLVGDGVGFNFFPLRDSGQGVLAASGCTLSATGEKHMIASTQNHWTIDSKTTILRAVDLPAWDKHGNEVQKVMSEFYGTTGEINFAERLGELSHMPPSISSRVNPYNGSARDADPGAVTPGNPSGPKYQQNQGPEFTKGPQWGMTIDQSACTGCGTCTVACQAENNIAVVGKKETAKGREMAWIRVDRYFAGDDFNSPSAVHHQPVACVHCENAPCEVVCPVNATVHGPEGLNYMTYNRCIGTRYCANNCPYKVRRYNWFDYGVTKFNGGYAFKDTIDSIGGAVPGQEGVNGSTVHNKINPNLIPPRLRQKLDEISKMQKNPDVTVRSRGVMEKCTYCVQRINAARIDAKLADLKDADGKYVVPEGFFQTACQQACPSNAIIFGNILDKGSRVHAARANARSYALLGYLNTRPRTTHLVRVMNPNRALLAKTDPARLQTIDDPFHHGGGEHGGGHEDGGHGTEGTHSFFDKRRRGEDGGYALSLRVLGGGKA
ncbi:MAG: TAT-variant-translocated molybdopterin oxidoreductase [Phycisphaerales bacterium]